MPYDVAFRHQQALDPSALTTIVAALHAVTTAIDDCRNAGVPFDADPGVLLLARHLGHIAGTGSDDSLLRRRCEDKMAELKQHPALATLAIRGVAYDAAAKDLFHVEGRAALRRLAAALGLSEGEFDLRSNRGHVSQSGEITLQTDEVRVQLSLTSLGSGHEVNYRRVRGRHDHLGDRARYAMARELLASERFAERLRRELRLTPSAHAPALLAG